MLVSRYFHSCSNNTTIKTLPRTNHVCVRVCICIWESAKEKQNGKKNELKGWEKGRGGRIDKHLFIRNRRNLSQWTFYRVASERYKTGNSIRRKSNFYRPGTFSKTRVRCAHRTISFSNQAMGGIYRIRPLN